MTSARKLLKNGRPEKDDRGRIRWKVRVKTPDGAWTSRIVWAQTEAEATGQADEAQGRPVDGVTWSQAVDLWDTFHAQPGPKHRVDRYRAAIRGFSREFIDLNGDKSIAATTRQDWQRFLDSKTHGSGRTANNARSLRQVAVWLKGRQDLGRLDFLDVPRIEEREGEERRAIPRAKWPRYIRAAKPPLRFIVEFLFATGWRAMEAAALTDDRIRGGRIHAVLKGGYSWSIPETASLSGIIRRARAWKRQQGLQERPNVFLNARGRKWTKDMLLTRWEANQRAAKLPEVYSIHEIRHSVCTALGNAGLQPVQISSLTGHRNLATLERYTHKTDESARAAAALLSASAGFTQTLPKIALKVQESVGSARCGKKEKRSYSGKCPCCGMAFAATVSDARGKRANKMQNHPGE